MALLLAALVLPRPAGAAGPLRVSPINPRYFTDDSSRAIYLTGSHTWTNLIDAGHGYPPPVFDYTAYLDFLEARGHNFFRLWGWEHTRWMLNVPDDEFWLLPGPPWARTGPGLAEDGLPRFDLAQLSQLYFDTLRARCQAAGARGVYVSVMLFDGWSVASNKGGAALQNPWRGHPFRQGNNINGIDGDLDNDDSGEETHELVNPAVLALQETYVRKVIDSVNDLDNILYEISNESHSGATDWQSHMISLIHDYEATLPKQHPVGLTVEYPGGTFSELLASDAEWISPNGPLHDRPLNDGSKVVLADTDHLCGICGDRAFVWQSFLRGENPIFMDEYTTGDWEDVRWNLGYARSYADRVNLAAMAPSASLSSTGYCLATQDTPAAEYLVYTDGAGFTVDLTATAGVLAIEWFDPESGQARPGGTVSAGAVRAFSPPFAGDAVLYLSRPAVVSSGLADGDPAGARVSMPNPLGAGAAVAVHLPRAGRITMSLFDAAGRRVWTSRETDAPAGSSTITLGSGSPGSGTYFWTVRLDGRTLARGKLTIVG